jgi:NAD(P)-dependent dehydrogenase (short-subunit alcohol dehydrogenase family)
MDANQNLRKNQKPKAVLITGAADRIGLELAKECLELGYRAIIHYRSSPEPASAVFDGDERVMFIKADLTESPKRVMDYARDLPVTLEGLVNNASVFRRGDLSDPEQFHDILSINALAPLSLSTAFANTVKSGWIINISDARNRPMSRKYQNYRISKLFLDELTKQLAYLYAPFVRVNAIAPGATLPSANIPKEGFGDLPKTIPLGKTGDPRYIRQALRFLVENDYMTGAVIPVDGGWHL